MTYIKEYVGNFRNLKVYQKASNFREAVYRMVEKFPDIERYNMCDQLRRASSSIGANLAEGNINFYHKKDFDRLNTALGSVAECRAFFDMALVEKYITPEEYEKIERDAEEILKMLIGMMKKINRITGEGEL